VQALRDVSAAELAANRAEAQHAAQAAGLTPDDIGEILDARPELPRPLLSEERATLMAILAHADFDGRDALVTQAETAQVNSYCGCGCATVGLEVDRTGSQAPDAPSPIPNTAHVFDADGEPIGGIIVFLDDGYLTKLEIYWYENPISPFPPLHRLILLGEGVALKVWAMFRPRSPTSRKTKTAPQQAVFSSCG
jgi:hypothetical protein